MFDGPIENVTIETPNPLVEEKKKTIGQQKI
jgi:hypothetical protein